MRKFEVFKKGNVSPYTVHADKSTYNHTDNTVYFYNYRGEAPYFTQVGAVTCVNYYREVHDHDNDRKKCTDCRCQGSQERLQAV